MQLNGRFARQLKQDKIEGRETFEDYALLGDGGIYDNLGLERAKGYKHVLISNAGDPFEVSPTYDYNWASQIRGTIRHMHRQVEQRRKIHFGDLKAINRINLLLWEIDDVLHPSIKEEFDGLAELSAWKVATFPVRLSTPV